MKFKLNKSQHLIYFNLLNKFDKTKLNLKDNNAKTSDNLIFYTHNNKLNVFVDTIFSKSNWEMLDIDDEVCFSIDASLFYNAFHNFPFDEIQCVYMEEKNSLIFGNKKTRVALSATQCQKPQVEIYSDVKPFNKKEYLRAISHTSFSCASETDLFPYNSINISFDDEINAQSSDKHRISFYGDVDFNNSYVISKTSADISTLFLNALGDAEYQISQEKLILKWSDIYLSLSLNSRSDAKEFLNLKSFLDSEIMNETLVDKSVLTQSIKFVSSIVNTPDLDLHFLGEKLSISGTNNEKNAVIDTVDLLMPTNDISVKYLSSHLLRALDIIHDKEISITLHNYNGFTLMALKSDKFSHIIFPKV